jgi:hypothetical protein
MAEVITDLNGTIIAMCAADDDRFAKRKHALSLSEPTPAIPRAEPLLRARPGQVRHVMTLPDSVVGMSLKEIHTTHHVVVKDGTPHLERIGSAAA